MKKLVLVLVSAVILTVFIAFNYLLWDRENKIRSFEYITDTKNSSIDNLRTELNDLKEENDQLKAKLSEYEDLNRNMQLKIAEMDSSKTKTDKELAQKKAIIGKLVQQGDFSPLEESIKKWAESIEKDQYETAYNLQHGSQLSKVKNVTFEEFVKNYKNSFKSVKLKSVKLLTEENRKNNNGSIIYKAVLEVKKTDNSKAEDFKDGANERYFLIDFDSQKDEWIIVDILSAL